MKIDKEFQDMIPPLTADEYAKLEKSLKEEGCRDSLIVWKEDGILLDGHTRHKLCEKHGIKFKTTDISLPDRLEAMIWIRRNQAARRNLTDDQRAMNGAALAELESKRAMQERAKAGRAAGGDATNEQKAQRQKNRLSEDVTDKRSEPKKDTRKAAANRAGTSEHKIRQAQTVRNASPELAKKVADGEIPLAQAVRDIKRKTIVEKLENVETKKAKELEGVFDVIVIDPPWPMEKIERDERPNQSEFDYPTMTEEQIAEEKPRCAKDCHVWLWTTHKFLPMAFRLLEKWGLKYVCAFVWHKPGGFQPIGLPQYNCEFALYARKGSPSFIDTKAFPVCFNAPRGKHSEKPKEFYDIVRRVTAGRRLDMYNRRDIEGFEVWGKEAL